MDPTTPSRGPGLIERPVRCPICRSEKVRLACVLCVLPNRQIAYLDHRGMRLYECNAPGGFRPGVTVVSRCCENHLLYRDLCPDGDGTLETLLAACMAPAVGGQCLSILGTMQPGPLSTYLNEAIRGGTGDDGLMQRFQLSVWPDDPGEWRVVDRYPDKDARNLAFDVFGRLENLNAVALGAEMDMFAESGVPFFRFEPAAQERFNDWMTVRENHLRREAEHPAMESHLTKYRKLIPALSLLIHLAEGREGPVQDDCLARAIGWGKVLGSHARRIYSCGIDPGVAHARALVRRIRDGEVTDGFTVRDVYHSRHWSMLADARQVQLAVDELIDLDWLRTQEVRTAGRPKVKHRINPKALAMISHAPPEGS